MIRSELLGAILGKYPELNKSDADTVLRAVFDTISDQLAKGGRVELRGFGSFSVREREARIRRNPRTGEQVEVDASSSIYFRAGKPLLEKLNS